MIARYIVSFTTMLLLTLTATTALGQARMKVLEELTPPPRLLLRYQEALGLTTDQKKQLKQVLKEAQAASLDLEFKVQEEAEKLAQLMAAADMNVDKVLAQADKLMVAENALKRVKLQMLLKTKKLLTPEQLQKIEEVQKTRRENRRERVQQRRSQSAE